MKIAIVGAGGMAYYHLKGFRAAGAEVVAIADMNKEKAGEYARENNIPHVYGSLTEMIQNEKELDAVSIITPNKFHAPLCKEALKAGLNVFCEKPPALNAKEMQEVADAAKESGKTLMYDFNNRARPDSEALYSYVKAGEIGRINSAQAEWIRRAGIPGIGGWFTNSALSGGGPVIDLVHMLDLSLYLMDYPEPEYVLASTFDDFMGNQDFKGPWGIADNAEGVCDVESASHAFIRFKSGQCLYTRASWAEMNEREKVAVTFQGSKAGGKIERLFGVDGLDETATDTLELYTTEHHNQVNRKIITERDDEMGRVRMASSFIKTLEGKEEPKSTPEQAVRLMKIIDALYESAKTGKPVEIR